jgi:hypothetical protein
MRARTRRRRSGDRPAVLNPSGPAASLELGEHPIADALRSLGLPMAPVLVTWMPHMRGSLGAPEKR